jgi:hypothetical protein
MWPSTRCCSDEVLELQPVREQHPANEPAGGDGEAALVEGHERYHIPRGRARHGLIGENDPLDGIGEGRKLAHLDQMEELLVGDIGARPVGHHDSEVLGELEAHTTAVLRMRKNSERKWQVREEEEADGEAKSRTSAPRAVLKGGRLDSSPSKPGLPCQRDFRPRALPGEPTAHSRDGYNGYK